MQLFDRGAGLLALPAREMRGCQCQPDLLGRQRLRTRRGERTRKAFERASMSAGCKLQLRDTQECAGMLGQRRENLLVDRARVGGAAGRFVARGKREGVLNGELHRRERGR